MLKQCSQLLVEANKKHERYKLGIFGSVTNAVLTLCILQPYLEQVCAIDLAASIGVVVA